MNREQIVAWAREAGFEELGGFSDDWVCFGHELERFFHAAYAAGAKAEQDRCCKIVYGMAGSDNVAQRTVDAIRRKE